MNTAFNVLGQYQKSCVTFLVGVPLYKNTYYKALSVHVCKFIGHILKIISIIVLGETFVAIESYLD